MGFDTARLLKPRPYWPFMPLFFSIAGWALLHAWLFQVNANIRTHLFPALLGSILAIWSVFPHWRTWHADLEQRERPPGEPLWTLVSGALLLFAIGAVLGSLVALGSLFLLAMAAASLNFVPWARLPFSRHRSAVSCAMMGCAFTSVILIEHRAIEPMLLPLASWSFWMSACVGFILRAERSRHAARDATANGAATAAETRPVICDT